VTNGRYETAVFFQTNTVASRGLSTAKIDPKIEEAMLECGPVYPVLPGPREPLGSPVGR
jgi:hypothetical protein